MQQDWQIDSAKHYTVSALYHMGDSHAAALPEMPLRKAEPIVISRQLDRARCSRTFSTRSLFLDRLSFCGFFSSLVYSSCSCTVRFGSRVSAKQDC